MKKFSLVLAAAGATGMVQAETTIKNYGILKAGYLQSSAQLKTFGTDSFRAPTEVADIEKDGASDADQSTHTSIQTQQGRWGMAIDNGSKTTAKLEFDLTASSAQSSPNAISGANLRLRLAQIDWKSGNSHISAGQKWLTFAGLNPHTFNLVSANFRSGNSAFIENEFAYTHSFGKVSVTGALANKGTDVVSGDDDETELGSPMQTIRVDYKMKNHHVGFAMLTAEIMHKDIDDTKKNNTMSGQKVFWDGTYGKTNVRAEYFTGTNLNTAAIGLTLGAAADGTGDEIKETGAWLSIKHLLEEGHVIFGYGFDKLDKAEEAGSDGIAENTQLRLAYGHNLDAGLTAYGEYSAFTTGYYRTADDEVENSQGTLAEVGLLYKF